MRSRSACRCTFSFLEKAVQGWGRRQALLSVQAQPGCRWPRPLETGHGQPLGPSQLCPGTLQGHMRALVPNRPTCGPSAPGWGQQPPLRLLQTRAQRTERAGWYPAGLPWRGGEEEAIEEAAAEVLKGKFVGQQRKVAREQVEEDVAKGQVAKGLHCRHSRHQPSATHPAHPRGHSCPQRPQNLLLGVLT